MESHRIPSAGLMDDETNGGMESFTTSCKFCRLDLHLEVFIPKKKEIVIKKKEIAVATTGRWGVTKYLQLDWMDDGTDGWMEKASRP
jgi:hypothetical protein